jgi:hypothetical protein
VLDRITTTPGFAEAMRKVGWLEGRDNALSFPRFDRHNGQTAKNRALTKERVAKTRNDDVTLPSLHKRYQRREEKSIDSPTREADVWQEPERDQIVEAARAVGLTPEQADIWHNDHLKRPIAPDGRWTDRDGRPIGSWRHALAAWAGRWKENERQRQTRSVVASAAQPKPAEGVWHLEKRIEAAQKEVDRIQSNPDNKEQVPDSFDRRLKAEPLAKVKALKASINEMRQRMAGVEVAA